MDEELARKISYLTSDVEASKWLRGVLELIVPALASASERRMTAPLMAIVLAQAASGTYAAARMTGKSEGEAYEAALKELGKICEAARELLEEARASGSLEESYKRALDELSTGSQRG